MAARSPRPHCPPAASKGHDNCPCRCSTAQLVLAIDDRVAICFGYLPGDGPVPPPPARPLAIGTRRLGVVIRQLAVWRDVYYTQPRWGRWAVRGGCQLGGNELFVLGDNSPISDDSRSWHNGPGLPLQLLVGTVVGAR